MASSFLSVARPPRGPRGRALIRRRPRGARLGFAWSRASPSIGLACRPIRRWPGCTTLGNALQWAVAPPWRGTRGCVTGSGPTWAGVARRCPLPCLAARCGGMPCRAAAWRNGLGCRLPGNAGPWQTLSRGQRCHAPNCGVVRIVGPRHAMHRRLWGGAALRRAVSAGQRWNAPCWGVGQRWTGQRRAEQLRRTPGAALGWAGQ